MLKIRMKLDLIDRRRNRARFQNPVKMFLEVVTYANGLSETLGSEFLHLLPLFLMFFFLVAEEWRMNQVAQQRVSLGLEDVNDSAYRST